MCSTFRYDTDTSIKLKLDLQNTSNLIDSQLTKVRQFVYALFDGGGKPPIWTIYKSVNIILERSGGRCLGDIINDLLNSKINDFQSELDSETENEPFLRKICDYWAFYDGKIKFLSLVFINYDRVPGLKTVSECAHDHFIRHLLFPERMKLGFLLSLNDLLREERNGGPPNTVTREAVHLLTVLGLEESYAYEAICEEMTNYFQQGPSDFTTAELFEYIEKRIMEEEARFQIFRDIRPRLVAHVHSLVFFQRVEELLGDRLSNVLNAGDWGMLERFRDFFINYGIKEILINKICRYFGKWFDDVVSNSQETILITHLAEMITKASTMVTHVFKDHGDILKSIHLSAENSLVPIHKSVPSILNNHIHGLLTSEIVPDLSSRLDDSIYISTCLRGSFDQFMSLFIYETSFRLIYSKYRSLEDEALMLSKLRQEIGPFRMDALDKILSNYKVAIRNTHDYYTHMNDPSLDSLFCPLAMSVSIFASAPWIKPETVHVRYPEKFSSLMAGFEHFFSQKNEFRELSWINVIDRCTLAVHVKNGVRDIEMSLLQAVVLLLFESEDQLNFAEIQEKTEIHPDILENVLRSITSTGLLHADDKYRFNPLFDCPLVYILPSLDSQVTQEVVKSTEMTVKNRQEIVGGAVMNVLKEMRTAEVSELNVRVVGRLKFSMESNDLKEVIDELVGRGYMERHPDFADVYKYKSFS